MQNFNNISFKILIITVISNETTNELTIYVKICRKVTIFYRQEIASLFEVQEKLRACRNSEWSFSSSSFIAGNSHIKIISSHAAVFNQNAILCFSNNVHLLKYFPIKLPQNCYKTIIEIKQECKFLSVLVKGAEAT